MASKRTIRPEQLPGNLSDPHDLSFHLLRYLEWMRVSHYSLATVGSRELALEQFVGWCAERSLYRSAEITRPILERFRKWLYYYRKTNGAPLHISTQYQRLVALRAFFKWLSKESLILYNPASELQLPRRDKQLPRDNLTEKEAEQVIDAVDLERPLGLRDRAMIEIFYSTGVRARELAQLTVYDVHFERGTVLIRQGKGRKDRVVPIGQRALDWISRYLEDLRPRLVKDLAQDVLFLGTTGEPVHPGRLSAIVRRYVKAALCRPGACHLFRHTMATLMLEGGADVRYIQAILGHAELSTTQIYTQVSIDKLKRVARKTHPAHATRQTKTAPTKDHAK